MKSIKRILSMTLMLAMVLTMMVGSFCVSAAAAVTCTAQLVVVDDDFAGKSGAVSATVAGTVYNGTMGTTAFATITEAIAKVESSGSIYVAAGIYSETIVLEKSVHLYGNQMNVRPNNILDISAVENSRAATGANETILQSTQIAYKMSADVTSIRELDLTVNGFALAGDSCIALRGAASNGANINISYNVFDITTQNAYANVGIAEDNFYAVSIGAQEDYGYISNEVVLEHNRINKVAASSNAVVAGGISTYWVGSLTVNENYVATSNGASLSVGQLQTATTITGNYFKDGNRINIFNNIGGVNTISENIFDGVGESAADYALAVYSDGSSTVYSTLWKVADVTVDITANTFKNVDKAIYLSARTATAVIAPYGTTITDNAFLPLTSQCKFVSLPDCDGTYTVPVYDNYTGEYNPYMISSGTEYMDFGDYWLNEEMSDSSLLLKVLGLGGIATTADDTVALTLAADIKPAPYCLVNAVLPATVLEYKIQLDLVEGAYYKLYTDKACTTPLANDSVTLEDGVVQTVYAKVFFNEYSIVYTVTISRKPAYTAFLEDGVMVVNQNYETYATGQIIYLQMDGAWYRAQMGHTAFATLAAALEQASKGDTLYLAAGNYDDSATINKGVTILGAKAGINPNDMNSPTFERSAERSDENEESIISVDITLAAGIDGLVIDGIMLSGTGHFTYSGTFKTNGIEWRNILSNTTAADSLMYMARTTNGNKTSSDFVMYRCRFERGSASYIFRMPNISSGIFEENVFYDHNKAIYMGGADGTSNDVMEFKNNVFYKCVSAANLIYIGDNSASTATVNNSIRLEGNRFIDCTAGTSILRIAQWRTGCNLTVTNNRFEGTTAKGVVVFNYTNYTGQSIDITNNYFGPSMTSVLNNYITTTKANVTYNYYASGSPADLISGSAVYSPYYADEEMTVVVGGYEIEAVKAPAAAVLDKTKKTITYTAAKANDELEIDLQVNTGATYALYSDYACTEYLDDTTLTLAGARTTAYAKVLSSDGVTYNVYTITVNQPVNTKAELLGMNMEGSAWQTVTADSKYKCVLPNTYTEGPLPLLASAGAVVTLYAATDTAMTTPIDHKNPLSIPAGQTNYLVKVVSEDGATTKTYSLVVYRDKSNACDITDIEGGVEKATVENNVASVTVTNSVSQLLPVLKVSGGATYTLYTDIGLNIRMTSAMSLKVGENTLYANVTAEDGTAQQYKIVVTRQDKSSENYILPASFSDYATSQAAMDEAAADETNPYIYTGFKRINNDVRTVVLYPTEFVATLKDTIVVSVGATYDIYSSYDFAENQPTSASLSNSASPATLALTEGDNVFYVRVIAENGAIAVYTLTVRNAIFNTENDILGVTDFSFRKNTDTQYIASTGVDGAVLDIVVSDAATVKVFADRKKTVEVASSMMTYDEKTVCRLTNTLTQGYLKLYVEVTSQSQAKASYELIVTSGSYNATFSDISTHWAKDYITQAYNMAITKGYSENGATLFKPQNYATREQTASFICNLLGVDASSYTNVALNYGDATKIGSWAKGAVAAVTSLGIMEGDGTNFNPKNNITRQEFMAVMVRACALDTSKASNADLTSFKDSADISNWAKMYVQTAVSYGLVNGTDKGYINPKKNITRAEIVKIMVCAKDYARA